MGQTLLSISTCTNLSYERGATIVPTYQMKTLRPSEVKYLTQRHRDSMWWIQDSTQSMPTPEDPLLNAFGGMNLVGRICFFLHLMPGGRAKPKGPKEQESV